MGPTRKRDLTAATVLGAVVGYMIVVLLYRYFPPIDVWTGVVTAGCCDRRGRVGVLCAGQDQRRRNR